MRRKVYHRSVSFDTCLTYGLIATVVFWCMFITVEYSSQHQQHTNAGDAYEVVLNSHRIVLASNSSIWKNVTVHKKDNVRNSRTTVLPEVHDKVLVREKQSSLDITTYNLHKFRDTVSAIYFVKVHKAGSTSIQNMLYRYGLNNDLPIALFSCPNGMPFPQTANKKYLFRDPFHSTFNIMCDHALYDKSVYTQYMPAGTATLGILRHPLEQLRSSIAFHGLVKPMRLNQKDPTSHFLTNPSSFDSRISFTGSSSRCGPTLRTSFTQNGMAYHFGYTHQNDNSPESINQFIQNMDSEMDFVMILERYDESLVLLKRMFHWHTYDILSLPLFSTASFGKASLKTTKDGAAMEQMIERHKQWSTVDYELYDHFKAKLDATFDSQPEDFHQEVQLYKLIKNNVREHCKIMCSVGLVQQLKTKRDVKAARDILRSQSISISASDWNNAFNVDHIDCLAMTLGTLEYQAAVRTKQILKNCKTSRSKPNEQDTAETRCDDDKYDYMFYTFDWPKIQRQIFKDSKTCLKYFS